MSLTFEVKGGGAFPCRRSLRLKRVCAAFYQAANATELANVLKAIADGVNPLPCDYPLAVTPSNPNFISVLINGTVTASGSDTWKYVAPNGTFPR